jgi:hypothetical protein
MPNAVKMAIVFAIVGGAAVITYRFVGPKVA